MNLTPPMMEFHISRKARNQYDFDQSLFSLSGNVIIANFHAARVFAQKMNEKHDLVTFPDQAVRAGHLNAMGLIDEMAHLVLRNYRMQLNPALLADALQWLYSQLGKETIETTLRVFCDEFPPLFVYRGLQTIDEYLEAQTEGIPNRQIALEEMLMLWLANLNPAFAPFIELFEDGKLRRTTAYPQVTTQLQNFFATQPTFGSSDQNLVDMLRGPALASPDSLFAQLEFIRLNWGVQIKELLTQLLTSQDLIREEEKPIFLGGGPGPALVYEFRTMEFEPEAFSQDLDWMPRLVMIAKNSYVWLDQLSKKYNRPITHLDEVPDAELEQLARWGITGLWLIGVWERSRASENIKRTRGNPEAVASAYSLYDYQIAQDLGGPAAYQNLRERAWRFGVRMASDMVPNHMGIDSRWVIEHPDWFVGLDYSPFPMYTFNGQNLSSDERVAVFIEDHYYNNSDAAVVFKRLDQYTGSAKFIYHGNDGTAMPWNDTAQLNYLLPEVREAVIQTILHVARQFPIIRFDAAMTLAKRHYQRLWFPEPGSGGDIPTRAEHGLTKEQFDAAFPVEFWREVVDRVAQEAPDTLLLAEAFWMMEGYFVRSLGMHRVYNSAFMNMLRDEKNIEYRLVIKNTLEFDPEILKRYVNFMNNPDERTAVDQFGKGDKYFGACVLMATMPGLPMFGHGQVEGYTEKYGMEYRRAYWDETVDGDLVRRHEREVFPLLRRRRLFAEVDNFRLYDLFTENGSVNEDVFAYSNLSGEDRSLVLVHNRFQTARGWIKTSAAYSVKTDGGDRLLEQRDLGENLGLMNDENTFTIFRDHISGLEYLRNNQEIHRRGLNVNLEAYKYRVFLDFRQVRDDAQQQYAKLAAYLQGGGVPSISEAIKEAELEPILTPFRELVNPVMLKKIISNRVSDQNMEVVDTQAVLEEVESRLLKLLKAVQLSSHKPGDEVKTTYAIFQQLTSAMHLPVIDGLYPDLSEPAFEPLLAYLYRGTSTSPSAEITGLKSDDPNLWGILLSWIFLHQLGRLGGETDYEELSLEWIDELLLGKITGDTLQGLGMGAGAAHRAVSLIHLLTRHQKAWRALGESPASALQVQKILRRLLNDPQVQSWINVNRFQDTLWFNKESFDELIYWMFLASVVETLAEESDTPQAGALSTQEASALTQKLYRIYQLVTRIMQAETASGFQVEKILAFSDR